MRAAETPIVRIGIADANLARRDAVERAAVRDGLEVAARVASGPEALALLDRGIDVLLLGLHTEEMDALTTLRALGRAHPVPVVVLADEDDAESMLDAVSLGAPGYVNVAAVGRRSDVGLREYLRRLLDTDPSACVYPIATGSEGTRGTLVTAEAGRIAGLADLLRSGTPPLRDAVHLLVDAPAWLVRPLARRLHRNTPWRVLGAREGDVLVPGHVLLGTLEDGLRPVHDGRRTRVVRREGWSDLEEARREISSPRSERSSVEPSAAGAR